jgi:Holliday junction resolvase RusA-like endonuclease
MSDITPSGIALEFTIIGNPATKGSVTAFIPKRKDGSLVKRPDGSPMVVKHDDTGKRGKDWNSAVAGVAFEAMIADNIKLVRDVPLLIEVDFYAPRPKGHFRTGRNAHLLKPDVPVAPCTRPDVDKLLRAILDALKNVVYADDGQVAAVHATKNFGTPARAEVRVTPFVQATSVEDQDDPQMALVAVA